ncbi:MAG: alpha/beta hydrolase [Oscillospiraceae bacterium]
MAFLTLTFTSNCLAESTDVAIYVPEQIQSWEKRESPVLWLFHGGGMDHMAWPIRGTVADGADKAGIIVVMPYIPDMNGTDPAYAGVERFLTEELPELISYVLPCSRKRENNYIAGLSVGGYFAHKIALSYPHKFSRAGSFSSPLDIQQDLRDRHLGDPRFQSPEDIPGTQWDLFDMLKKRRSEKVLLPDLYLACGTEDHTWESNLKMRSHLDSLGIGYTWDEGPGGHDFHFWNTQIAKFFVWLRESRG